EEPSLSGKVTLVQETETDVQVGFLMYLPIYKNNQPHHTLDARQANLIGWAYSPFRIRDFLNGILAEQNLNLDLEIYDGDIESTETLMYDHDNHLSTGKIEQARFDLVKTIPLMGHHWTVKLRSTPNFEALLNDTAAWLIAINGIIISILLSLLFHTVLRSRSQALKDAQELRIAASVFASQEGMFVTDNKSRILRANPAFTRLTGYSLEEVIGKTPRILKSYKQSPDFYRNMWTTLHQSGIWEGEIINRRKDGETFPEYLSISAVKNLRGEITHFVAVFRDITQKKQAELAIAANKAKSEFLANMSHEIRTPMNGVIGMLEVLSATELDARQHQLLDIIRHSAQIQLNILNDILDFSKIEAGKLELAPDIVNVESIVENSCLALDSMAISKRVNLRLFVDPKIPDQLLADGLRLTQILNNLINNAIKFSSQPSGLGEVEVRAKLQRRESNTIWVDFSVTDNGIGMDASTQKRLFQHFEQADPSTTRRFGGTGLGLAIVRQLIGLMGGQITVSSRPQQGSTFTLRLPLGFVAESFNPPRPLEGLSCWLISDQDTISDDICMLMEYVGVKITRIQSDLLATVPPQSHDILVIRIFESDRTPTASEIDTITSQWHSGKLVIMQKSDSCGRRRKPRQLAPHIIQVDGNLLTRQNLLQALAMAAGLEVLEPQSNVVTKKPDSQFSLDRNEALRERRWFLIAEDHEVNQAVILNQLHLLGYGCDIAANGREALALWQDQDYALILTDLHMPDIDGYQLCSEIRRREQTEGRLRTPIIALTAVVMKGEEQHCLELGMDDYLSKPAPLSLLKAKIEQWLYRASEMKPQTDTAIETPAVIEGESVPIWDDQALTRLVGDDPETLKRFVNLFSGKLEAAEHDIQDWRQSGDTQTMAKGAHALKSAARSVGAMRLGQACQSLENAGKTNDLNACLEIIAELLEEIESIKPFIKKQL
ncbi:MAG: hypothetical protein RL563_2110, partial [Pseudomonadota bacterium]